MGIEVNQRKQKVKGTDYLLHMVYAKTSRRSSSSTFFHLCFSAHARNVYFNTSTMTTQI